MRIANRCTEYIEVNYRDTNILQRGLRSLGHSFILYQPISSRAKYTIAYLDAVGNMHGFLFGDVTIPRNHQ